MLLLIELANNCILVAISTNLNYKYVYFILLKKQMNWRETYRMRQVFLYDLQGHSIRIVIFQDDIMLYKLDNALIVLMQ